MTGISSLVHERICCLLERGYIVRLFHPQVPSGDESSSPGSVGLHELQEFDNFSSVAFPTVRNPLRRSVPDPASHRVWNDSELLRDFAPDVITVDEAAGLYGAARVISIDVDTNRLEKSREFGATDVVISGSAKWHEEVMAMTDGAGVDVAIEAVGIPETFEMATQIVRPGGHVANVGVHGKPVSLALQNLWIQNVSISMGLVNTNTTPLLLKLVQSKKLDAAKFATHFFTFDQFIEAYDTFSRAAETKALKVVISVK